MDRAVTNPPYRGAEDNTRRERFKSTTSVSFLTTNGVTRDGPAPPQAFLVMKNLFQCAAQPFIVPTSLDGDPKGSPI